MRSVRSLVRFGLIIGAFVASASPAKADIGVMVLEPIGTIGFLTRAGHSAIYLSNVCPDGSPVILRLCGPGEGGGVISKYTPISESEDYDWAIVPFGEFLTGFRSPDLMPLVGGEKLRSAIQADNFNSLFSRVLTRGANGRLPDGEWKATVATRLERTIYNFVITTTVAEDKAIVEAFNAAPNKSRFNFFYRNCSNQAKAILNLVLPDQQEIGDRLDGLTMEAPKGLAKSLVERAEADPTMHLRVERYIQVPGPFERSRDVLFPMENTYKNISFAPYWYFMGYSEFAVGALLYHQLFSPFSLINSMKAFASERAAALTLEQQRLTRRQDEVRAAMTSMTRATDRTWLALEHENASVFEDLRRVNEERDAEVNRIFGSKEQWHSFQVEFHTMVAAAATWPDWPEDVTRCIRSSSATGELSRCLVQYFETDGDFFVDDAGRGPWMRLPFGGPEQESTGISTSQILTGSPRVAFLVLATAIDYNLSQSDDRRETVDTMDRLFALLRPTVAVLSDRFTR